MDSWTVSATEPNRAHSFPSGIHAYDNIISNQLDK